MAIVSCPECSKKLKVADESVGKKMRCPTCKNVFLAETDQPAPARTPPAAAAVIAPEKVFVACTECESKLKVATTSLGKKMKCPKCASVFLANLPEDEAPAAKSKGGLAEFDDDLDDAPAPKAKAKGKPPKKPADDEDDLFAFAQAEAGPPSADDEEDDEEMEARPKGKGKKKWDPDEDEEDEEPTPRAKGKKPPKPKRPSDDDDAEQKPPVYPSRLLLNILVSLMTMAYLALFVGIFLFPEYAPDLHKLAGMPAPKGFVEDKKRVTPIDPNKKGDDKKVDDKKVTPPQSDFAARQKEENDRLAEYKKGVPVDVENVVAILQPHEAAVSALAFSPAKPMLAAVSGESAKDAVTLWDLKSKTSVKPIMVDIAGTRPLAAFSPDGELLAVASGDPDKFVKVFKVSDGAKVLDKPIDKMPHAMAFSSDGKRLTLLTLGKGDSGVYNWSLADGAENKLDLKLDGSTVNILSPLGDTIVEVAAGNKLSFVEISTGMKTAKEPKAAITSVIQPLAQLTRDGKFVINPAAEAGKPGTRLDRIDLETGDVVNFATSPAEIDRFAISPDGKFVIYSAGEEHKLVEVDSKKAPWNLAAPTEALAISPGGVFVARTEKNAVHLLSVETMLVEKKEEKKKDEPKTEDKKKTDIAGEAFVKGLGGQIVRDEKLPGMPIVEVSLNFSKVSDADLPRIGKEFPELRKLSLGSPGVTGVGIMELARLKHLEKLDLGFSGLSDEGAGELGLLKQLKMLSLVSTKITDVGVKDLADLVEIEDLNLASNKLGDAGLKQLLPALKKLKKLEIGNTQAGDETAAAIVGLAQLESLHMYGSRLTDDGIQSLAKLASLKDLRVGFRTSDKAAKHLAELKELRSLSLFATQVGDGGIKELAVLTKMENLNLTGTQVTDKGLADLAGMKELRALELNGTPVSNDGMKVIADLKKLERLDLADTKVDDTGLKILAGIPTLQTLILRNAKVTDAGVAELKKTLPKCQVIR